MPNPTEESIGKVITTLRITNRIDQAKAKEGSGS